MDVRAMIPFAKTKADRKLLRVARGVLWIAALGGALFALKSIPDLRRYLRIERM